MTYSVYTCTGGKFNIDDWDKGKCFKLPEDDTKSDPDPGPSPGPGPNPKAKYIYNSDPGSQSAYKNTGLLSRQELEDLYNNYNPTQNLAMIGNLDTVEYAKIQSDASSKSCKPKDISFLFSDDTTKSTDFDKIRAVTISNVQTLCTTYGESNNFSSGKIGCESATIGEASGDMTYGDDLINKDKPVCNWESEGKCFPITYDPINKKDDKGNPQYFYNPIYANKYTEEGTVLYTSDICAELKNRTTCDNERRENILDSVKNICKWTTGIGAFVDPELNFTGAANLCDEGPAYKTQVGTCKVNRGLFAAMGVNNVGDGSYTSNPTGYSQVQCAGADGSGLNANYTLVTRAQCDNSTVLSADGNTRSCFFEPTMGSYELRNGYRLEKTGEYDIAKASSDGAANRRCTKDNNDIPCMQSQEDFVNCGTCVKNPAVRISETQKNIIQTTSKISSVMKKVPKTDWFHTGFDKLEYPRGGLPGDAPSLGEGDLNEGDEESIKITHDYEVYKIQNGTNMLKICVRKVGDINENYNQDDPQMPTKIRRYLHDTDLLSKIKGSVWNNRFSEGDDIYNWGGNHWYKQSDTNEQYTRDDYKAHLDKFNNYNLEIRIHPDYEDIYKFGMGTKDSEPTSTIVCTNWYFNRLLQLPIHERQFINSTDPNYGLPEIHTFFKLNSLSTSDMRTYPNEDMDYLYFYTADNNNTRQLKDGSEFIFKVNWDEIVTKIHKDPECGRYNESRFTCTAQTKTSFKGGNESMCLYTPKVHCKGEWRDPPTVLDDYGNNVANTCGLVQPGVKIKQYVELSAGKLDAINDVWNPGNYKSIIGAQCEEEDIGWLVYQDLDASSSGQVATDKHLSDPGRQLPQGITGTPQIGTWKRAVPKHGDLKYVACDENCVEETFLTFCETPGDVPSISPGDSGTFDERRRMNFVVPEDTPDDTPMEERVNSYDFSNAWYASENSCSGNFTEYKTIKTSDDGKKMLLAQGEDGKACPNFSLEHSRGIRDDSFDYFGQFTRGGACTLPKQNCIAGSSCIVNTDNITKLVGRINRGENLVKINNGTAGDDDSLEIEIDGTRYNKQNNITEEILFRLAKKECDRFGDLYGSPNKAFCTEDKEIYISETPGVPPCEYKPGSCYVDEYTTTYTSRAGIKVFYLYKKEVIDVYKWYEGAKTINPFEFCKWIEMEDLPSE